MSQHQKKIIFITNPGLRAREKARKKKENDSKFGTR
jgi:hypothetical protein